MKFQENFKRFFFSALFVSISCLLFSTSLFSRSHGIVERERTLEKGKVYSVFAVQLFKNKAEANTLVF